MAPVRAPCSSRDVTCACALQPETDAVVRPHTRSPPSSHPHPDAAIDNWPIFGVAGGAGRGVPRAVYARHGIEFAALRFDCGASPSPLCLSRPVSVQVTLEELACGLARSWHRYMP